MKYKFQFENGNISEGSNTLYIKDSIATVEAEDLTPAVKLLIEAHGGQLAKPKQRPTKAKKAVSDGGS